MSLGEIVSPDPSEFLTTLRRMQKSFTILESSNIPTIVAIHGECIGAGFELACACDIRFCSDNATFSLPEINLGIVADLGGVQRFGRCVGSSGFVRDVCFSGKKFGAVEALKHGFVKSVGSVDLMRKEAWEYCHMLANKDPRVLQGLKYVELCRL